MRSATAGERIARLYASIVVALRYPIVLAWIAGAVLAVAFLPQLGGSSTAPLGDILPSDAQALKAEQRAVQLFGSSVATDVVVVEHNRQGLSSREVDATVSRARATLAGKGAAPAGVRAAVPLVNAPAPGVRWGERDTTALSYLFLDPSLNLVERDQAARAYARSLGPLQPGTTRGITGAGPARLQQFDEIDQALPWVTLATVLTIIAIVALYFRSVGAPLVTLATAGLGYVIAVRVLAWGGERAGVTAPSEIEPVLVVLLLGVVTDYTVFFMSETRRRLLRGEPRVVAARRAASRIAPIVLTAGVLVAAGAASLLAGQMQFFRVFGPGLAICALVVTLLCVTLVPALMALLGPWLFGRRVRRAQAPSEEEVGAVVAAPAPAAGGRRERWRLRLSGLLGAVRASRSHAEAEGGRVAPRVLTRLLTARPVAAVMALVVIAVLVWAAAGARTTHLAVSFVPSLPADSSVRQAATKAEQGFVPGVLSPTDVIVEAPGIGGRDAALASLQRELRAQPGVAAVLGPAQSPGPPVQRFVVTRGGGAARFVVLLSDEPTGAAAIATVTRLQDRMPQLLRAAGLPPDARVSLAGETALAKETVDALVVDLERVAVAMAVVTFVLLAIFLRALMAPVLLLLGSGLAYVASFGLMALLLPHLVGGSDVVYYVPLVALVLLVGLGSDYNVFIAGRIREEAQRRRHREAVAVGAPSASRAITVAGVTLAATFALLALVPLRPFRELALLMSVGVLVDALLVRPLLIPMLIAAMGGRVTWWPGRPQRPAQARAFLQAVAARTDQDVEGARVAARATLCTLSERIPEREARELARHLPDEVLPQLDDGDRRHGELFGLDEFVRRVAERACVAPGAAWDDARAVIAAVGEAVPEQELDYVRAALSADYQPLFGDAMAPVPPGGDAGGDDGPRFTPGQPGGDVRPPRAPERPGDPPAAASPSRSSDA
ncbi:MAG TPA: MMPL family transporter [Baekduia sp.]|nr:MMPL family transporter [Baekduia sp.]